MPVRKWRLELRSGAPVRVRWTYDDLRAEVEYYGITVSDMARFLGVKPPSLMLAMRKRGDDLIPRAWRVLLAVLSQFPPVFVRNRLKGYVHFDFYDLENQYRQKGFKDGAEKESSPDEGLL